MLVRCSATCQLAPCSNGTVRLDTNFSHKAQKDKHQKRLTGGVLRVTREISRTYEIVHILGRSGHASAACMQSIPPT